MNKRHAMIALSAGLLTFISQVVLSDSERGEGRRGSKYFERTVDVAPVKNSLYAKECGECHFAYQPGLLPERSWRKMMDTLNDHFGDNAELPPKDREQIMTYLAENSAEHAKFRRSEKIMKSLGSQDAPERITDLSYFRHQHDEVPQRLVKDNQKVGSFANCSACHTRANEGSFSEHEVKIPGAGNWDDD